LGRIRRVVNFDGSADAGCVTDYLAECRALVLAEIEYFIPKERNETPFYGLMLDYPRRRAKALRPALCIAACRALGGAVEAVLPSAAAIELYHNAFLIHDDVEDGSHLRRDEPTLHRKHGVPIAMNVGDGMLALALDPLLSNTRLLGLGKALRILRIVARMARESAEGQAVELAWVRDARWDQTPHHYMRMVHKKTSYYSFITPLLVGGVAAGASDPALRALFVLGARMGPAFQIQDDALNLVAEPHAYGKEIGGDLWEGKHTLILIHMLSSLSAQERIEALAILAKGRPDGPVDETLHDLLSELAAEGQMTSDARRRIEEKLTSQIGRGAASVRTSADVARLFRWIERHGSVAHARRVAVARARAARRTLVGLQRWMKPSVHRAVLMGLLDFITERDH
jgi:geranylgeranyl diphosphate synthase type II